MSEPRSSDTEFEMDMLTLPETSEIRAYYVYEYHFLDDLSFIKRPETVFSSRTRGDLDSVIHAVRQRFLDAGWEGDGDIGVLWLPPFVGAGIEDTWGTYVWHVKQSNNGTSFLASPYVLPFGALRDPTADFATRGKPINIIETDAIQLSKDVQRIKDDLRDGLQHLRSITLETSRERLVSSVLAHYQAVLIRTFFEFMDNCYLRFLIEGLTHGNRRLKLARARVHLDPLRYLTEDDTENISVEGNQWLTLQGITSDIWRAFKMEPYRDRMQMLCAAVQFTWDSFKASELMKHVTLRNCMQHHEGKLDADSLRRCGVTQFVMRADDGTRYSLSAYKPISLSHAEVCHLAELLEQFGHEFNKHVDRRIPTRLYLNEPEEPAS